MSAIDITRHLHQPAKRYSGLVQFQGSVILDAEMNERDRLQEHAFRRLLTDFVCSRASPDDGFKIEGVSAAPYDFAIKAGSLYLGGMRFDMEKDERFLLQSDWLQQPSPGPTAPTAAQLQAGNRFDAVYCEGFEQAVTGTEDGEIVESALGGPQTSARMRRMRRIRVKTGVADNCPDAFDAVLAELGGTFNRQSCELVSNRRLRVGFQPLNVPPDPCAPSARTGYLGAENETIQVRVVAPDRFIWGFGNASPLYRVTLRRNSPAAGHDDVEFHAPPRDQTLRPRVGDMIELIRCDSILANGQLAGEHHGLMTTVDAAYNPETRRAGIRVPGGAPQVAASFSDHARTQAMAAALAPDLPPDFALEAEYYYARVWRGESIPVGQNGVAFGGAAVLLGTTGVTVRFFGDGPVGDYWTFSVRPHTPDIIVPWEMRAASGVAPTGLRRHVAPLALIEWFVDPGDGAVKAKVHDCRRPVRKLCEADGCCEITVGDGHESHGDVDSLAAALDLLPDSGGTICLLRGNHDGHVVLDGLKNVTIKGCGRLSTLHGKPGEATPVITLVDCVHIKLHDFAIDAPEAVGLEMHDSAATTPRFGELLRGITVRNIRFGARDRPAIIFDGGEGLVLKGCKMRLDPLERSLGDGLGLASAVILLGARILVERCRIRVDPDAEPNQRPFGGIHVLGGSEDVELRRNRISGGSGTGIQLGSISMVQPGAKGGFTPRVGAWLKAAERQDEERLMLVAHHYIVEDDGCIKFPPGPKTPDGDGGDGRVPDADLAILRLRILDNDIAAMGGNGIGVFAFFDLFEDPQFISVSDVEIRSNRIEGCVARGAAPLEGGYYAWSARGGVVLAHAELLVFEDNRISGCGSASDDPVCGFFCVMLEKARFEGNTIEGNGARAIAMEQQVRLGQRGGIVVRYAMPATLPLASVFGRDEATARFPIRVGTEALLIAGNRVSAPEGRALQLCGIGAMSITGNQLESQGATSLSWLASLVLSLVTTGTMQLPPGAIPIFLSNPLELLFGGAVVSAINLCLAGEFAKLGLGVGLGLEVDPDGDAEFGPVLTSGKIMFNDNQTHFDALAPAVSLVVSGLFLFSLDDIQMNNNQCDADLLLDMMITHVLAVSVSLHMQNNRLSEPYMKDSGRRGLQQVYLSAITFAGSNITTLNFSTHCILALTTPSGQPISMLRPNMAWLETDNPDACGRSKPGGLGYVRGGLAMHQRSNATWKKTIS